MLKAGIVEELVNSMPCSPVLTSKYTVDELTPLSTLQTL
jgi:hypothetical protein